MGVVAVLYLAGPLNAGPVFNLLGGSSAVAVALGQLLFVAGDALACNYARLFGHKLPFPSIADPFNLAIYPCLMVGLLGLLRLLRLRHPKRDCAALIDALVVAIGSERSLELVLADAGAGPVVAAR